MTIKRVLIASNKTFHEELVKIRCPVEHFSQAGYEGSKLRLQYFELKEPRVKCTLYIYFGKNEIDGILPISAYGLKLFYHDEEEITFECKIWIENESGEKCMEDKLTLFGMQKDYVDNYIKGCCYVRCDFRNLNHREFFTNDLAIFCAEFRYPVKLVNSAESDFRRELWLTRDSIFNDCTLKVQGKELKASKYVLVSQSEVFKRMMTMNTIEAQTSVIEIPDASYGAVESFLEFLYLRSAEKLEEFVEELFVMADKYCVESLKYVCKKCMLETLNDSNVADRLILSFIYNDRDLKWETLNHVMDLENAKNYKVIFKSEEWKTFARKKESLAKEIVDAVNQKKKKQKKR